MNSPIKLISLIMPTYNRAFIIELAIQSIIHQKEHTWNIELLIGDDGEDNTENLINGIGNSNTLLKIQYIKMDRISISDKINKLVKISNGEFYGIIGSDDIQSPFKISSFEKALKLNSEADVFGQRSFVYHDIIFEKSNLWIQNKAMEFFKAGSFVILRRNLFDRVGGYPPGLWKRVDGSFYKRIAPLKPKLCDVSKIDQRVIKSSIALQHIDNIWNRKAKGLNVDKPKQLANFFVEPIEIDLPIFSGNNNRIKNNLIQFVKTRFCIKESDVLTPKNLSVLNILIVVSLDMRKQTSASHIRPAKMIGAFKKTAYNIDIIESPTRSKQRINILKNIVNNLFTNKKYDLCYYEPSTFPLQRTERLLISWLKKKNTWISYFHRDMYWRYEIGIDFQFRKKFDKHKLKQEDNLDFLEKNINLLFTPTDLYATKLKSKINTVALPPAGNLYNIEYNNEDRDGVIYVGGVSERYGTNILLQSFKKINEKYNIPLTIVSRITTELFMDYKDCSWLNIKHWDNAQVPKKYSKFKIGIIPIEKSEYHDFTLPFKLFEYASFGLPIAVSDNYEQIKLVEENKIGINIGSTVESFSSKIMDFYNNIELLNQYHQNTMRFIKNKGLWKHRVDTIITQYRESNGR